jgi:putative ABC transport system permease protein
MDGLLQDLRYGFRVLAKSPGFSALAVITLALGVAANTAIFSILDAVLLHPLAISQPERLVILRETWRDLRGAGVSVGNFADVHQQNTVFEQFAATGAAAFNLALPNAPERVEGENVSADYFAALGVQPLRGRWFTAAENEPGHEQVVILSERLWRDRFHAEPSMVGQTIRINGLPTTVVGIMPADFDPLLSRTELWLPAAFTPAQLANHDEHYLTCIGRLKPRVSVEQAQSELDVIAKRLQTRFPIDDKERGFNIEPITQALLGDQRVALYTIVAAVGFVLLIACANIANLQLARARGRQKEIAIRVALGATPQRIVRQLMAENVVVGLISAVLAVVLAFWGETWLLAVAPADVPRIEQAHIDGVALAFACGIALLSSFLFGLAPALRSASAHMAQAFKEAAAATSAGRDRVRSALVVAEVALALVLLVGAGLLIRSAMAVSKVDPGFETANLVVGRVGLPETGYSDPAKARNTFERIMQAVRALPGVQSAAIVSRSPLGGGSSNGLLAEGRAFDPSNVVDAHLRIISPDYIATARVPLKAGRVFTDQDTRERPLVVLVNETLARTMWPGQDPLGKRFACCEEGPKGRLDPVWHQVVGVVGDVRAWGLDRHVLPEFYMPIAQMPPRAWDWIGRTMDVVVRTNGAPIPGQELRAAVAGIAPGVPIYGISTMQQKISSTLQQSHFDTFLLSVFAAAALFLACLGVYGVMSYIVTQRTREIGIRMALGATRSRVIHDVLGQGMRLTITGVVAGAVIAFACSRLISALLYGVRPSDVITFAVVSIVLVAVALLATYVPARRASHVDPIVALRYE